jgi:hypothetical protein
VPTKHICHNSNELRHTHRVDYQRDVISNKNSCDILPLIARKEFGNIVKESALLAVYLVLETVLVQKRNLHTREEGREQQHQQYDYYRCYHINFISPATFNFTATIYITSRFIIFSHL